MINEDGVEIEHGMVVYEPWKGGYYRKTEVDAYIRKLKYKRCLAMAMWCRSCACFYDTMRENNLYWGMKSDRAYKWHNRWFKLAKKFKPNSTAQQGKGKQNE